MSTTDGFCAIHDTYLDDGRCIDCLGEAVARLEAALGTVAGHDGFALIWDADCSCQLCEADRAVARCLGWERSSQGVPLALAGRAVPGGEEGR